MLTHLRLQHEPRSAAAADERRDASLSTACCISCFRLMPAPPESPPEGRGKGQGSPEPELLCASCILHLAGKSNKSPAVEAVGGAMSPLPKLSQLVKAEAKCQDQLELLRGQQPVLQRQRDSLQATKQAKEEAIVAERELARQRRKHFLLIQERRKREEELKFQQFQSEEHTSRSEQDAGADKPPRQKKKQQPRPPKLDAPLQIRKSETTTGLDDGDSILPHVAELASKHSDTSHSHIDTNTEVGCTAEAHSASLNQRRRQMMACYSQDLSPLIDGRKPRRLPFPKPVAALVVTKRRQTPDNNAPTTTNHHSRGHQQVRKSPAAARTTKLRPLEEQKQYIKARPQQQHASNQFEDIRARGNDDGGSKRAVASPLSLHPPRRLVDHQHASPLTAEIKPVSWAYELAKDVLPQDDDTGSLVFSALLHPVAEEESDAGPQFTMFPLQRQLPNRSIPPARAEPPAEATAKPSRWEYSSERLSSLLEKYNVSVSAVAATPAPSCEQQLRTGLSTSTR